MFYIITNEKKGHYWILGLNFRVLDASERCTLGRDGLSDRRMHL